MIRLKSLLKEINSSIELAFDRIDKLPAGKLFNDAKSIKDIFTLSKHGWSEVIENFEKNKENGTNENVDISNIHITQPNIQSNKVKHIIENINNLPNINVVQFNDGEMAIYDGHHRLVANWALGNRNIKVNLVKLNTTKYDASGIDTPGDPNM
jgi:hypothetical protein